MTRSTASNANPNWPRRSSYRFGTRIPRRRGRRGRLGSGLRGQTHDEWSLPDGHQADRRLEGISPVARALTTTGAESSSDKIISPPGVERTSALLLDLERISRRGVWALLVWTVLLFLGTV